VHHIKRSNNSAHQLAVAHANVDADLQWHLVPEGLKLLPKRRHRLGLQAQQEVDAAGEHVAGVQPLQRSGMSAPVTWNGADMTACARLQTTRMHEQHEL
jgi:hypothetical protein